MAIKYLKEIGIILLCDFRNTISPEMTKKRPVVVLAKPSWHLGVIVPLSTTDPEVVQPWHYHLHLDKPLPHPYDNQDMWAKCDMVCTVSFERLSFPFSGKDRCGKRILDIRKVTAKDFQEIRRAVAAAIFPGPVDFLV